MKNLLWDFANICCSGKVKLCVALSGLLLRQTWCNRAMRSFQTDTIPRGKAIMCADTLELVERWPGQAGLSQGSEEGATVSGHL